MNPYNNCWSNSVLQVLCGLAVANYLPSEIQCPIAICKHLAKIHKQLHVEQTDHANTVRGALAVSHKMRAMISLLYKRDQKHLCMQDNAADFLDLMLNEISDNCLTDYSNFDSKTIHISGCSMCEKVCNL